METEAIARSEEAVTDRLELYKVVASEAWEHGAVTARERELMEALRKALQIPKTEATRIEDAVKAGPRTSDRGDKRQADGSDAVTRLHKL